MNKKVIVLDLDGTTLDSFESINKKNVEVINKLKETEHIVCIATGRPFRSSKKYYNLLGLDTMIANFNGTHIIHPFDEDFDDVLLTIDVKALNKVMSTDVVRNNIENAFCEYADEIYLHKADPEFHQFLLIEEKDTPIVHIDLAKLDVNPNSMIIKVDEEYVHDIMDELAKYDEFGFRRWTSEGFTGFIEIFNKVHSKATALEYISKYYNVPIEDFIAIGDEENDIEMVKHAGTGVCVQNASPKLKAVADIILDKINKEGAVGHFLEEYFNL